VTGGESPSRGESPDGPSARSPDWAAEPFDASGRPLTIVQATGTEYETAIRELFGEYLHAVCPPCNRLYGTSFDPEAMLPHDMAHLEVFAPPEGRLLLAFEDGAATGVACVRTIGPRTAEIKRMFVRPAFRRRGIGRALVDAAVVEMREAGYTALRLDSARFMSDAHSVYRGAGFREIEPYLESEVPREFHEHWVFMELSLVEDPD
jgi:GNAT superfamily N-acetyltransferase